MCPQVVRCYTASMKSLAMCLLQLLVFTLVMGLPLSHFVLWSVGILSAVHVIAMFLIARLLHGQTLQSAASATPPMPYQRGQFWVRRFRAQATALCATLAALTQPASAPDFVHRALTMLESTGWIAAHRFLFAGVRCHLLGWPRSLAPDGRRAAFSSAAAPV